MDRSIFDKPLS